LEDLYEFVKFNLRCYNIFKIKNALIYHSLKNYFFNFFERLFNFPSYFPPLKVFLSPPIQTRKQSLIVVDSDYYVVAQLIENFL